ncbi:hypothetical protein BDP81DRAFT_456348 [Colletotrichum phormii]|uniref:Nephrocystin-3 n=1 Tax=Colletotrichum phormii TaxID=359342 RepID=A0AAJ0A2H1_9PEZI|nr:uncharacterized protein BDP81DRAFT_456348 [Colletotrichum phormii]KAK1655254.1 hypothetical protein BDP81DRAFT_456348 [Colletotrichum phormii]
MAASPPRRREDFTVAVICALPLEFDAVELAFDELWEESDLGLGKAADDENNYMLGRIGKHNAVLVVCGMGKVNAANATARLRSSFGHLKLALLCGICGGVPSANGDGNKQLGDVVISKSLFQYDLGRLFPGRPPREIRSLLTVFETHRQKHRLRQEIFKGLTEIQNKAVKENYDVDYHRPTYGDVLFQPDYMHRHRKHTQCCCNETLACEQATIATCDDLGCDTECRVPRRHLESQSGIQTGQEKAPVEHQQPLTFIGSVGTGDTVVKSGKDRDRIAREHSLVAFEMKGAGVWDQLPCIIVKGVCDYADSHKNKTWQHYAAATAAAAAKALLHRYAPTVAPVEQATRIETPGFSPKFEMTRVKNPGFVGREEILNRIKQLVALNGLGGVGKTQIALAYAYWVHETFPEASVFWVHASNHQRFRQAFTSIAQVCGITGYDENKADTLLLVKQWLESKKSGRWLLIIDNADDKETFFTDSGQDGISTDVSALTSEGGLGRFIPECLHGSVLITTRDMQTGLRMAAGVPPIKVNEMIGAEAVEQLRSLLPNQNIFSSEAIALASRLEYLPLVLAQAACFIFKNSMSINDYVQLLDKSDSRLVRQLSEPFASVGRDSETPHALTATWLISFRQVEERYPLAGNLLSFMSMFDRQAIPKAFDDSETTLEVANALGILQAFSFISQASNGTYDMHRLVHLVTRKRLLKEKKMPQLSSEALGMMARAFPYGCFENRVTCLAYLPHALALLIQTGELLYNVAGYFDYLGQDSEADTYLTRALELRRQALGQEHPKTLKTMGNLALSHINQDHLEVAVELLLSTLEAQKRLLAESDKDVLYTRPELSTLYFKQGQYEEAEKLQLQVLERDREMELGRTYTEQGRLTEAEQMFSQALARSRALVGEEHDETVRTTLDLGRLYRSQGRLVEAEELFLKMLELRRITLGEEHKNTAWIMGELGFLYSHQLRLAEAEKLQLRTLEVDRKVLREGHVETLIQENNLAWTWWDQGRKEEAIQLMRKCAKARERVLGRHHEHTKGSLESLSHWEKEMDTEHSSDNESGHGSEDSSEDEEEDTYARSYVGSDDDSDDGEGARL